MIFNIIEIDSKLYATWVAKTEDIIGDAIMLLPEGSPFMGVPWEELKPGKVIESNRQQTR